MARLATRDLGEPGRDYVRSHLGQVNALSAALLRVVEAMPGEAFTLAPENASLERLTQFKCGGLLPENLTGAGAISLPDGSTLVPVISLAKEQAKLLHDTMMGASGAVCLVDDVNPRWSERPSYLGPHAFGVGDEVYHLLTHDQTEAECAAALSEGRALWHSVAAVCSVAPRVDSGRNSTASELERSATSALVITCMAYDGEGFVAWRRKA